jgi:hypothetical protein
MTIANINFTSKSGMTPLILAIQNQRSVIVSKLISKGAKVTVADPHGVTPLAMASRLGNANIMELLLKAGAECNDGSLHDAARELRCDAIRVLIEYGQEPDYPSELHDGRSALAELCLNAVQYSPKPADMEEAIVCLVGNGADIQVHCVSADRSEKSIFHYALDSADPLSILNILLKLMWQKVNDEAYLYTDETYTYSLTKYVEKDIFKGPHDQKDQILSLLRNKRAVNRFWANDIDSEQPIGYCGGPPDIEKEFQRQKLRRKRISEKYEDVRVDLDLKRLTTVKEVEFLDMQSAADIVRNRERAQADLDLLTERADKTMELESRSERERQRFLVEKQNKEVRHLREMGNVEVSTRQRLKEAAIDEERTRNMLQIEYTDADISKQNEGLRARLAIEGSAREDADKIDKRQNERQIARMKMQQTLADKHISLAGSLQGSRLNQKQIGYVVGEVS